MRPRRAPSPGDIGDDNADTTAAPLRRSTRLKRNVGVRPSPAETVNSVYESSSTGSPSMSSVNTNITTPSPTPKYVLSASISPLTRKVRIPALTGKAAHRRIEGGTSTASEVSIPIAAVPTFKSVGPNSQLPSNPNPPSSLPSTPSKTNGGPFSPIPPPSLSPDTSSFSPKRPIPFGARQLLPAPSPICPPPADPSAPLQKIQIKEDESLIESEFPFARQPTTRGTWRVLPQDIPINCRKDHPDSLMNRSAWSAQQQLRLIDMGFAGDLQIESVVFMTDGYIIDWKTKIPVDPVTLKPPEKPSSRKRRIHDFIFYSGPLSPPSPSEGIRRSTRKRRKSWKSQDEIIPGPRSATSQTFYSGESVADARPTKKKRGMRSQQSTEHPGTHDSSTSGWPGGLSQPQRHAGNTDVTGAHPRSSRVTFERLSKTPTHRQSLSPTPVVDYEEEEEEALVEMMLQCNTSRSPSPMEHSSIQPEGHIGSDDDLYMSWSDYEKAKATQPPNLVENHLPTRQPPEDPDTRQPEQLGVAVPVFNFGDRVLNKDGPIQ